MEKLAILIDHLLELAFISLIVRTVAIGAGIGDALAIVAVVASIAYAKHLNKSKVDATAEINKKIEELSNQVQSLKLDKSMRRQVNESQTQQTPRRVF